MSIRISSRRIILVTGFFILVCVWTAAAACPGTNLTVSPSSVIIDNPGALTPGMTVSVSARVDFPTTGSPTYPPSSQLELSTSLDDPVWTWKIVRNGVKKPETEERRSRVVIRGDDLSWPEGVAESLEISLSGTAPLALQTENRTLLKIQDITSSACTISPVYQYNAFVLNTSVTRERINGLATGLARLQSDAETMSRAGRNISGVREKIADAQRNLDTANATSPFEYASVAFALNNTETAIAEGKRILDNEPTPDSPRPREGSVEPKTSPPATAASPSPVVLFLVLVACTGVVVLKRRGG